MKSLTLFILSVLLLQVYVNSTLSQATMEAESSNHAEAGNHLSLTGPKVKGKEPSRKNKGPIKKINSSKVPKSLSSRIAAMKILKAKKKAIAQKRKQNYSSGDKLVCGYGQNLGLLQGDQHCRSVHLTKCRTMIKRDIKAPKFTKVAAISAIVAKLKGKGKYRKLKRRKFSLKNRRYSRKPIRSLKGRIRAKVRIYKQKLSKSQKRKIIQRKAAKRMLDRMLDSRNRLFSFKKIKKMAKTFTTKKFFKENKNRLTRATLNRLLRSPLAKRIIAKHSRVKNPVPAEQSDEGDYCVHAVEFNLNYCCYFPSRSEAQQFANTQPDEFTFNKMLMEGRWAARRDRERRARKAAKRVSRALALLKKFRKNKKSSKGKNAKKAMRKSSKGKKAKRAMRKSSKVKAFTKLKSKHNSAGSKKFGKKSIKGKGKKSL